MFQLSASKAALSPLVSRPGRPPRDGACLARQTPVTYPNDLAFRADGAGLRIVSPQGLHLGTIRAAANGRFTNLAFGGDDGKTLFLTAPEGLYGIRLVSPRVATGGRRSR